MKKLLLITALFSITLTGCFKKESDVWLRIYGTGSVTVDWGNGSVETKIISQDNYIRFIHKYSDAAQRNITILGENITTISCFRSRLTSLDVSGCPALTTLNCQNSQLVSLNVSGCTALTELICSSNQLTSLDLSVCHALARLICDDNQLTSLDVSGCTALTYLTCDYNQLMSLDVSGLTELTWVYCNYNQLTSLNVSGCAALAWIICRNNQLTSLNMSENSALEYLLCGYNYMTAEALDNLFSTLNNTVGGKIYIWYNGPDYDSSGTNGCDRSIAESKGWTVVFE